MAFVVPLGVVSDVPRPGESAEVFGVRGVVRRIEAEANRVTLILTVECGREMPVVKRLELLKHLPVADRR